MICVLLSRVMQNFPFSTALTPIPVHHARLRARRVTQSTNKASRYPLSSTPLCDKNASSRTKKMQEPVVPKKPTGTGCNDNTADRKRGTGAHLVEDTAAKRICSVAVGSKDSVASRTVSGHSRIIESMADKRQQQKREVTYVMYSMTSTLRNLAFS